MIHRPASPRSIEELPVQWTATASPPGGSSPALSRLALPSETPASLTSASTLRSSSADRKPRQAPQDGIISAASTSVANGKGKGRQINADVNEMMERDHAGRVYLANEACCSDNEIDNDINITAGQNGRELVAGYCSSSMQPSVPASSVSPMLQLGPNLLKPDVPYRPHHPQNEASAFGFGVKGNPGGDCKRVCLRHQRMVDGGARVELQKCLEKLSPTDQQTANTIWSLFSSSSGRARILTLRGLLSICCPSQLSFLTEQLKAECRLDPFAVLPRELSLRCMGHLDAISLGRAAQVSKSWKALADDDLLWRTMCEQHIEKKCEKCGWGLPLLEKKRKRKTATPSTQQQQKAHQELRQNYNAAQHNHTPLPKTLEEALDGAISDASANNGSSFTQTTNAKRARLESGKSAPLSLDNLTIISNPPSPRISGLPGKSSYSSTSQQLTRPWKSVYCERLAIARNWQRGKCKFRVLNGHTNAVTCLQYDDTLHDPAYPVLMTGSWDRSVRIWNADNGECINVLRGHTRGVRCIQFDSAKLITGSMDSTLKIWSWRTGQCIRTLTGHRDAVVCLTFDKQILVSGSADSTIKIWDFTTAECFTLRGHREWVNQVQIWSPDADGCSAPASGAATAVPAVSADSVMSGGNTPKPSVKLLFSASDDGTVKVWDLLTRQCIRSMEGHVAQVQCLKVLSIDGNVKTPLPAGPETDNSLVDALSNNRRIQPLASQTVNGPSMGDSTEQRHHQHAGQSSASFAPGLQGFVPASQLPQPVPNTATLLAAAARQPPDPASLPPIDFGDVPAPTIISGSLDNTLKMWNVETAACSQTLFGHIEGVWGVDMDKLRIVSASHDRTIKIWDRISGRCLHTLVGHRGAVTSVALGDDKIISGSDDSSVRIWSFAQ